MPKPNYPLVAVSIALLIGLTACGPSTGTPVPSASGAPPSSGPSAATSPSPSDAPSIAGIDHPTGATEVVVRVAQGGGFISPDFLASQAPDFSLFGDGRVVFQQKTDQFPEPGPDGITHNRPWRIAQLDEGQVQELLAFALGPGGLGTARESYIAGGVADAPDTTFTINAGGVAKVVVVNALGLDTVTGPDQAARAAFQSLAARLQDFDRGGTIASDAYAPTTYRGILSQRDPDPSIKAVKWPWPGIKPTDFAAPPDAGGGGISMARRAMSTEEVAALGLSDVTGGIQGLVLTGPDGKLYSLILRPLLPDEKD
jgi:hypothetical protein